MKTGLTATLLVCVAAAGIAIGALMIDAGGDSDSDTSSDQADTSGGGYGNDAPSGNGGADTGSATLVIDDFDFSAVTVSAGATVNVDNQDGFPHTVTATDGSFDTGNVDANGSATFTAPSSPGSYQITCNIHPTMSGTVTVG